MPRMPTAMRRILHDAMKKGLHRGNSFFLLAYGICANSTNPLVEKDATD